MEIYVVVEDIDNSYDAYNTTIKLVTLDKQKAIDEAIIENNKLAYNSDYVYIEVWEDGENINCIDFINKVK